MKVIGISILLSLLIATCQKESSQPPRRHFLMGFANSAPRPDYTAFVRSLQTWSQRADAAIISTEVPWDSLLTGETIPDYIIHNYANLVKFYRQKGFPLWVYVDPENGLDRRIDAYGLVARGKSIADPDMREIYVRFVIAMDSLLRPDHLGLALETNLIRGTALTTIYDGVKTAAAEAAQGVRNFDGEVKLSISVQADWAWGKMTGSPYIGIDQDIQDFPFIQELGMSSYPYFNFSTPDSIPDNYYARLVQGSNLPVMVTESGWSSATSPALQQRYIERQAILLNNSQAIAWFQLTFTDIDIASLPSTTPDILKEFAMIGLVDIDFQPKPALKSWDSIFRWRKY